MLAVALPELAFGRHGSDTARWAFVWVLTMLPLAVAAATIEGKVVSITDGDTLTVLNDGSVQHKIRLQGIDAPEKGQPFGQRSKENLSRLVRGKPVRADCPKRDRYSRQVCTVSVQPLDCRACGLTFDAGLAQITQGLPWHYKRYEKEQSVEDRVRYADAEVEARGKKGALWADKAPLPPWEKRAARKREYFPAHACLPRYRQIEMLGRAEFLAVASATPIGPVGKAEVVM